MRFRSWFVACSVLMLVFASVARAKAPAGRLQLMPASVNFPTIEAGNGEIQSVQIENVGTAALSGTVKTPPAGGPFSVISGAGSFALAPGQSVTLSVRFAPHLGGRYSATIPIAVSAGRKTVRLTLRGTATAVPSGKVAIIGGGTNNLRILSSSEIYDPLTGTFTLAGRMSDSRGFHTATFLDPAVVSGAMAGEIFVTGGEDNAQSIVATTEFFEPPSRSFSDGPTMGDSRAEHTATFFPDGPLAGQVLLVGGQGFFPINFQELFNPATGQLTQTGMMNDARTEHAATLIEGCNCPRDGLVLVTGGVDDNLSRHRFPSPVATAELYDPSSGTFSCVGGTNTRGLCNPVMSVPRWEHEATLLPDGTVLITGGITGDFGAVAGTKTADIYDPATNTIAPAASQMKAARQGHTATLIEGCGCPADGKVLIAGGQDQRGQSTRSAELYDPATGTFKLTGSMTAPRSAHAATVFQVGQFAGWVLMTGGFATQSSRVLNSAELYNPFAGRFQKTGAMRAARYEHTATLLPP